MTEFMKSLEKRIDRLESLDAIRMLAAKYSLSLDMRDLDAHVNLFAPDIRVGRERVGRGHLRPGSTPRCATSSPAPRITWAATSLNSPMRRMPTAWSIPRTSTKPAATGSSCRCSTGTTTSASAAAGISGVGCRATGTPPTSTSPRWAP